MNSLYEYIFKRKSVRKYKQEPLSAELLSQIKTKIDLAKELYPCIKISCEIVDNIKSPLVKAPHYLLFSSEDREGSYENAGFILQQMTLSFTSMGIGSCFLGMGRPAENLETDLKFIIAMSFGYPEEPIYRELSDFNRKDISEISEGEDPRLEVARLAPSGMNSQNWFFLCEERKIIVYRKKTNPIKALVYEKMNSIDAGIAICNLYIASEDFTFTKDSNFPEKKGYAYIGTVE